MTANGLCAWLAHALLWSAEWSGVSLSERKVKPTPSVQSACRNSANAPSLPAAGNHMRLWSCRNNISLGCQSDLLEIAVLREGCRYARSSAKKPYRHHCDGTVVFAMSQPSTGKMSAAHMITSIRLHPWTQITFRMGTTPGRSGCRVEREGGREMLFRRRPAMRRPRS